MVVAVSSPAVSSPRRLLCSLCRRRLVIVSAEQSMQITKWGSLIWGGGGAEQVSGGQTQSGRLAMLKHPALRGGGHETGLHGSHFPRGPHFVPALSCSAFWSVHTMQPLLTHLVQPVCPSHSGEGCVQMNVCVCMPVCIYVRVCASACVGDVYVHTSTCKYVYVDPVQSPP